MTSRVLFVDDEPLLRHAYENLASVLGEAYSIQTSENGEQALKLISNQYFDVLVTDLSRPQADGMQFLMAAARRQPDCVRVIVSGSFDPVRIASSLYFGHRYFDKPCDLNELARLLLRLVEFRNVVGNQKVRRLIGGLGSLPGPPDTFLKLEKLMASPSVSIEEVAKLIEQHPAVTTKLLQIVNSAQFGLSRKILDVSDAVRHAGLILVRVLVLATHAVAAYQDRSGKSRLLSEMWDHSLRVAAAARAIARAQGFSSQSSERAFLAGLLHEIGRIVIAANAPDELTQISSLALVLNTSLADAQRKRLGTTFAEIGAYLLALWGIDDEVAAIVQYQDRLDCFRGKDMPALAALHVAHCAAENNVSAYPLDSKALERFGFSGVDTWIIDTASSAR